MMKYKIYSLGIAVAIPMATMAVAPPQGHEGNDRTRELKVAMGVAEAETGGEAVAVRRVAMNGTSSPDGLGGIEVLVHMPEPMKGWRCLIDSNNMKLRSKEQIPNPASKVR
jgi:hypothetical protein